MEVITNHELQKRSNGELATLFNSVAKSLPKTAQSSPARRAALATLENIARIQAERRKPAR